jgi:hypothetical protein
MRLLIAILALFAAPMAVTACAPQPTPEEIAAADCASRGGKMQEVGRLRTLQCVIQYADANRPCRTGSDCLGDCRTAGSVAVLEGRETTGVCQADSNRFGCYTTIEGGKAEATICVD